MSKLKKSDVYGTCPKCKKMGWCHYKGKARIFKSGPGSETYKVSIFKCGNCGKKFGFELEDSVPEQKVEEENNDWEKITEILGDAYDHLKLAFDPYSISDATHGVARALSIAAKYC